MLQGKKLVEGFPDTVLSLTSAAICGPALTWKMVKQAVAGDTHRGACQGEHAQRGSWP